jgi:hypothetical protein
VIVLASGGALDPASVMAVPPGESRTRTVWRQVSADQGELSSP